MGLSNFRCAYMENLPENAQIRKLPTHKPDKICLDQPTDRASIASVAGGFPIRTNGHGLVPLGAWVAIPREAAPAFRNEAAPLFRELLAR